MVVQGSVPAMVLLLSGSAWIGWVVVITLVFGVAMGSAATGNQTALYSQAPAEQLGTASGTPERGQWYPHRPC